MINSAVGLYFHIPFCTSKCAYCDFYSAFSNQSLMNSFTEALIREIKQWGGRINRPIDTIYFGGGTPSLLEERLPRITSAVYNAFRVLSDCEITLEINPSQNIDLLVDFAKQAGINRFSVGVQSGNDAELKKLGRTHTADDAKATVLALRRAGFDNISVDIMIGLPDSDKRSLSKSFEFICGLEPEHISAYLLKIEPKTLFYKKQNELCLPDDDAQAQQYLQMCDYFAEKGYSHYEISNFCRSGRESRHNLKYWQLDDYLGIGPSAHSCMDGERFYYPRDLKAFIAGNEPMSDGACEAIQEYIMLGLRLKSGISEREYHRRFSAELTVDFKEKCRLFSKAGLMEITGDSYRLTEKGMLLSNSIITELLE